MDRRLIWRARLSRNMLAKGLTAFALESQARAPMVLGSRFIALQRLRVSHSPARRSRHLGDVCRTFEIRMIV